jgi:hypothetical protein
MEDDDEIDAMLTQVRLRVTLNFGVLIILLLLMLTLRLAGDQQKCRADPRFGRIVTVFTSL